MNTIFVLLMIWSTNHYYGGVGVVQQEFSSLAACEAALIELSKAHNGMSRAVGARGCFKK